MPRSTMYVSRRWGILAVAGLMITLGPDVSPAGEGNGSLAERLPAGALGYAEVQGLGAVLDRVRESDYLRMFHENPRLRDLQNAPPYQRFDAGRQMVEAQLGMDLWSAGKKLLGRQVAGALYPRPNRPQPDIVLAVRVSDAETLATVRKKVENLLVLFAADRIDMSGRVGGVKLIDFDGKFFYAGEGDWIVASSSRSLLTRTVEAFQGNGRETLADDNAYRSTAKNLNADALLRAYVDIAALRQAAGDRFVPEKLDNAVASLLFGGIVEWFGRSSSLGLSLDLDERRLRLKVDVDGSAESLGERYRCLLAVPNGAGATPIPQPKGVIGGITLYRDVAAWYRQREELLVDRVLPDFDKFESGIGNLLPNRSFGVDVLPLLGSRYTFVSALQSYDYLDGEPGVKLPGFAVVAELAEPKEGGNLLNLLFQTVVAVTNLQVGQQGGEPMIMAGEDRNGVQISFGRHLTKPTGNELPIVANFTPASAQVGDKFIMSSSLSLCRSLVDRLRDPKPASEQPTESRNEAITLYPEALAAILDANRKLLQARSIQTGRTPDQARQEIDLLLAVLRRFGRAEIGTSITNDALEAELEVTWK